MSKIYNRKHLKMRTIVSHKTLKGNSLFYAKNIVVKKCGKKLFVLWTVDGEKVKNSQRAFTFPYGSNRVKIFSMLVGKGKYTNIKM